MKRLKILVLAPDANPESISVNLVCYRHAEALARTHSVTLAARACHADAIHRANGPFRSVEAISNPWLDSIYGWFLSRVFKNNFRSNVLTAFTYPFSIAFEWRVWRRLRTEIVSGEFDAVLRLSPIISVIPSAFPFFLRGQSVPFIIGPINGGLPWPQGFSQADKQRKWIDSLRSMRRYIPFARSTFRRAAAIIAGSSQTYAEFVSHREKLFFVPENGIAESFCSTAQNGSRRNEKLELIFVGGLVPYKACDLAIRAAAPLLKSGLAHLAVAGDGPERDRLESLAGSLGVEASVSFCGMLTHNEAMEKLRSADVLIFPSVREFGGGVVFEALALGAVPVVADFGGPGDIVYPDVGFKVPLTSENDVVLQMGEALSKLANDRPLLERLKKQGMAYARERLTWEAKAQTVSQIIEWAAANGVKPDLPPPKAPEIAMDWERKSSDANGKRSLSGAGF